MIRIFQLSTPRCRIAPLGIGDTAEIADSLGRTIAEAGALLAGRGERRLLGARDREDGRLRLAVLISRVPGGALLIEPHLAAGPDTAGVAAEVLAGLMRALAAAHPFDRLEADCPSGDADLRRLLETLGFETRADARPLVRAADATRIDVC